MRKTKPTKLLKDRKYITVNTSLTNWASRNKPLSTKLQILIAQDVIDSSQEEFVTKLYPNEESLRNRSHNKDTVEQEMVRMARWMLEGEIIDSIIKNDGTELLLRVNWKLTGVKTWVRIYTTINGFKKVLYDEVVSDEEIAGMNILPHVYIGTPDYEMYPEKKATPYYRNYVMQVPLETVQTQFVVNRMFGLPIGILNGVYALAEESVQLSKMHYIVRWLQISLEDK